MPGTTHEVRNSLIDKTRTFDLDGDALIWRDGDRQERRRYADIAMVHLISYPGVGGQQLQCTLTDRAGKKLKIRSHHYVSLANFEDRSNSYGAFVSEMVQRLDAAGTDVKFCHGSNLMRSVWVVLFTLSIIILVGYAFALIGGAGTSVGIVSSMTTIAVFLPVSWAMIRTAKFGTFDPNSPPLEFLGQ